MSGVASNPDGPIDVLVSYSSRDVEAAKALQALLEGKGLQVWRDATELQPGDPFIAKINDALDKAARVIVLWSHASIKSTWVQGEAERARGKQKLIPFKLDDCELPAPFNVLHTPPLADVTKNPDLIIRALGTALLPGGGLHIPAQKPRIDISRLPTTFAQRLFGREQEMAALFAAWDGAGADKTNILVLDAMGGTGKTALINHFVQGLQTGGWRGAEAVFVWSFYSQGTDEGKQASADLFFSKALAWFGHTGDVPKSQHDKGVLLADLVHAKRTLLVLDGLEPLQYGPSRRAGGQGDAGLTGGLRDEGLKALFRQLAADNAGLLLVTTRLKVPDLKGTQAPAVITRPLTRLDAHAGVGLLKALGVDGKFEELKALVEDLRGHALALSQIGTFLAKFHDGDIRRRDLVPTLVELGGDAERDPFRVMLAYETQFRRQIAEQVEKGAKAEDTAASKQLSLLFLMGLFDRPLERKVLDALLAPPAIAGLTEGLAGVSRTQWMYAVESLRDLGLLLPKDQDAPDDLDAHPLVREYFGLRLEQERPEAFEAAHGRLYDFYRFQGLPPALQDPVAYALLGDQVAYPNYGAKRTVDDLIAGRMNEQSRANTAPALLKASHDQLRAAAKLIDGPEWKEALAAFLPENGNDMQPLFAAIGHGAAAGRHDEAFKEVYWPRIARGNEKFATKKLGLYGSDLAALAQFFAEPFAKPAPGLSPARQALVLNLAGFRLRALGRLGEAVEPMRVGAGIQAKNEDWKNAASGHGNLSELLLTIGRVAGADGAVAAAEQSVAHADRFGQEARSQQAIDGARFQRMVGATQLADALAEAGSWGEAAARFREAEALQRERQPDLPLHYSLRGYQWCDVRLAQGRAGEVGERFAYLVSVRQPGDSLLDRALEDLAGGRAAAALRPPGPATAGGRSADPGSSGDSGPQARPKKESQSLPPLGPGSGAGAPVREDGKGGLGSPVRGVREDGGEAARLLDAAVEGLRAAGQVQYHAPGLLARAAFQRETGSDQLASKDLGEAFDIATRGGMRSHLIPAHIESAGQSLAKGDADAAAKALDRAQALIAETGARRGEPGLLLAQVGLALQRSDRPAAERTTAALVALMRAGDLWDICRGSSASAAPSSKISAPSAPPSTSARTRRSRRRKARAAMPPPPAPIFSAGSTSC